MTEDEAIETVARAVLAESIDDLDAWDSWPEVGEHDWERIVNKVEELAPEVEPKRLDEAMALLKARAEAS